MKTGRMKNTLFSAFLVAAALTVCCALIIGGLGCAAQTMSPVWTQANTIGENRVFTVVVDGTRQRVVWVSGIGHPTALAEQSAYKKARIMLKSTRIKTLDKKVFHRQDGNCHVNILATPQ